MHRTRLAAIVVCLALIAIPTSTIADPADTLGLTWAGRGSAGTWTAAAKGGAAAYYNPAGLALSESGGGFAGFVYVHSGLGPAKAKAGSSGFIEAGLHLPLIRAGKFPTVWFGLAAMTPPTRLYDLNLYDDEEPVYVLLDSRERRLSVSAALALELFERVSLGIGFELLPTVDGTVVLDLANQEGYNSLDIDVGYRLSPTAGITVKATPRLKIGLAYRGENEADVDIPVEVQAEGIELSARLTAQTYYVPHRLAGGVEFEVFPSFAIAADVTWQMFSRFVHPSPDVALYDGQGNDALPATVASPDFSDVVSPSLSVKYHGLFDAVLGYRWVPPAVDEQPGTSNLLDSHKHIFSLGGRVRLVENDGAPAALYLTADFFFAYFPKRTYYKEALLPDNPGYPSLEFGGYRLGGGLGLELAY